MRVVGLCEGRHEMPYEVGEFIYPDLRLVDFDIKAIDAIADEWFDREEPDELTVYVTGFTPALGAVVHAAAERGVGLTLMHYNRVLSDYVPQRIF